MSYQAKALVIAMSSLALSACNDNNSNQTTDNNTTSPVAQIQTARFIDGNLSGLGYSSESQQGVIGNDGKFNYKTGETVSFKLGGITLGSIKPSANSLLFKNLDQGIDPQGNLSNSTINRAMLLQTLDQDGDSSNGIQLDALTVEKFKTVSMLDFNVSSEQFTTQLASLLTSLKLAATIPTALLTKSILLTHEAEVSGKATEKFSNQPITQIDRFVIADQYVPYEGTDAGVKTKFPNGFPLAVGSGLGFAGSNNGVSTFYAITDRGPNADSPTLLDGTPTKVFPAPSFSPTLVKLTIDQNGIRIADKKELVSSNGIKITGLPLPKGSIGSTSEVALNETLSRVAGTGTDINGLDTEAIAIDPDGKHIWTCDEYGPFIAKVEIATGKVIKKFAPESGLPALIAKRQANRGCEGLAYDASNKKLYAIVQSTLDISKNTALFTRLVEFDPVTEKTTKTIAYPINPAEWEEGKAGKAKLGDLTSLGNGRFMTIEQGTFADGKVHNKLYVFDINNATDITAVKSGSDELEKVKTQADLAKLGVITARKEAVLADLKDYGWLMEKAEGLTIIDNSTLAVSNDNDFGLKVEVTDQDGKSVDATSLMVNDQGQMTDSKGNSVFSYKMIPSKLEERRSQLWIIKLAKPLK
jgi:hypothetical protein